MKASEMKVGMRYVVTNESDDGTFCLGEHIHKYDDGNIGCKEAQGWVSAKDAPLAAEGCEVEIDQEYIARLEAKLSVAKGETK